MVCELLLEVSGCHYVKLVTEGLAPQKPPCDCFARHNFYFKGEQIVCLVCDPYFAQLRYCSVNIYRQADVFHANQKLKLHSELMTNGTYLFIYYHFTKLKSRAWLRLRPLLDPSRQTLPSYLPYTFAVAYTDINLHQSFYLLSTRDQGGRLVPILARG